MKTQNEPGNSLSHRGFTSSRTRGTLQVVVALSLATLLHAQTPQFEVASIRAAKPGGFRFGAASNSGTGGPGTSDPGMYRCSGCTLAALISKAFQLEKYQLPASASLGETTFDVTAKIREGATADEFRVMLQNLLKERLGLAYHFDSKSVRGYHLTVAKSGAKLQASGDSAPAARGGHSHSGVMNFGGQARFTADHQTMRDLADVISAQLLAPVDDQTGLTGKYDISLNWSADNNSDHVHDDKEREHGDKPARDAPALGDALQAQLGLKLVAGDKVVAKIFIVDRVEKNPTEN